jgi:hypothetical protein
VSFFLRLGLRRQGPCEGKLFFSVSASYRTLSIHVLGRPYHETSHQYGDLAGNAVCMGHYNDCLSDHSRCQAGLRLTCLVGLCQCRCDKARIEAFLRRIVHFGYRADSAPTFVSICAAADDKLFALIKSKSRHLFHLLLPLHELIVTIYKLRGHSRHNFQLLLRTTTLRDSNFYEDIV